MCYLISNKMVSRDFHICHPIQNMLSFLSIFGPESYNMKSIAILSSKDSDGWSRPVAAMFDRRHIFQHMDNKNEDD